MSRNKRRQFRGQQTLDGDLTVHEARQILSCEGGELTVSELIIEVAWALLLGGCLAWSIVVGKATAGHLLVPLAVEYLTCLAALPIITLFVWHPELAKPRREALWALGLGMVALVITLVVRSIQAGTGWLQQANSDGLYLWNQMLKTHLQWPIAVAALHALRNLRRTIGHLLEHGPPFLGPGLGCGMRIAVFALAGILVPGLGTFLLSVLKAIGINWNPEWSWHNLAWVLWGCLLIADLCTLWFRWDVQNRLKKRGLRIEPPGAGDGPSGSGNRS